MTSSPVEGMQEGAVVDALAAGPGVVPQCVLPAQWAWGRPAASTASSPEARLMFAVLGDAVASFRRVCGRDDILARREAAELADWFFAEDSSWPFSFTSICLTLQLDPQAVREAISRWWPRAERRSPPRAALAATSGGRGPQRSPEGRHHLARGA